MNITKEDLYSITCRLKDNTEQIKQINANQAEANFLTKIKLLLQLEMITKEDARKMLEVYYDDKSSNKRRR